MSVAQKIQVAFGRVDVDSIRMDTCRACGGTGLRPRGRLFTYQADEPVDVGDVVLVPSNWAAPEPREATVITTTAGDYDGPISTVLRVVDRKREAAS